MIYATFTKECKPILLMNADLSDGWIEFDGPDAREKARSVLGAQWADLSETPPENAPAGRLNHLLPRCGASGCRLDIRHEGKCRV